MQASTCMFIGMVTKRAQASATKERIINAAIKAFAKSGLEGATTKEIARLAGVNEVTLFRHFQSKERLLGAVVDESMADDSAGDFSAIKQGKVASVREILEFHAKAQRQLLTQNLPLIRTFIGEIHRHCDQEKTVKTALFLRHKQALEADLKRGQTAGFVRKDIHLNIVPNQFLGVLFSEVLRRSSKPGDIDYTEEEFLEATVDLFASQLTVAPKPKAKRRV